MKNVFACVGGYGGYEHIMYEHLSSIGVNHLQIPAPSPSAADAVKAELDGYGFAAVALTAKYQDEDTTATDAATTDWMDAFDAATRMGVPLVHSSVKAHPGAESDVYNWLAKIGDRAVAHGITLVLETHPTLLHNGEVCLLDTLTEQLTALETDETLVSYKKQRERMARDPYRPIYHMSSLSSMGDPNGLCQWQGRYHLFYQFGPEGSNRCHWGHCYTDDLVHWRDLPPALYPDTEIHCFSGQTLVEDERVIAIYHGKESGNSTATATDPLLLNWEKHPDNPVIPNLKTDEYERPYNVFDPCIWKEEDGYYSISGTSIDGYIRERRRSASHLFYSKDLSQWKYLHPLLIDDVFCDLGEDGAVPNFLPIGHGKHILLLFSHKRAARYYIGEYDRGTHRFTPEYHGRINHGPFGGGHVACPSATIDSNGRCITILNCADGRQGPQSEWGRCMTLPWQLSLKEDTMLAIEPVDEVKSLRYNHDHFADIALSANEEFVLDGVGGKSIELDLTVEMGTAREVGVYVLRSPNGRERTKISIYNHGHPKTNDSLQIDTSYASLRTDLVGKPPETAPFYVGTNRRIRLRAFIDRSLIEVFADNGECKAEWAFPRKGIDKIFPLFSRQCAVARAYPEREDSNGISLFSIGGEAQIVSMDVWQMRSIWPELKYQEGA